MMCVVALRDLIPETVFHFLLDGTKLCIHHEDISVMRTWSPTTSIRITLDNVLSDYPFKFINTETGDSIRVRVEGIESETKES